LLEVVTLLRTGLMTLLQVGGKFGALLPNTGIPLLVEVFDPRWQTEFIVGRPQGPAHGQREEE